MYLPNLADQCFEHKIINTEMDTKAPIIAMRAPKTGLIGSFCLSEKKNRFTFTHSTV